MSHHLCFPRPVALLADVQSLALVPSGLSVRAYTVSSDPPSMCKWPEATCLSAPVCTLISLLQWTVLKSAEDTALQLHSDLLPVPTVARRP